MAKNTADIGFEKQIWDAACVLRGNMDASEYKNVVLGLIFLKYISDRFDDKYQELKDEGDGFEEDIDEYTSEGIFFALWQTKYSQKKIIKLAFSDNFQLYNPNTGESVKFIGISVTNTGNRKVIIRSRTCAGGYCRGGRFSGCV